VDYFLIHKKFPFSQNLLEEVAVFEGGGEFVGVYGVGFPPLEEVFYGAFNFPQKGFGVHQSHRV